jgi:hypothetical protein
MNQEVTHKLAPAAALILGFASSMCVASNPQGTEAPFDPIEPTGKKRVHRRRPFLCRINAAGATGLALAAMEVQHRHQPPRLSNGPLADVAGTVEKE